MHRDHRVHVARRGAVCNLASIALPRFVIDGAFDHQKLYDITYILTKNLNRVIDNNDYPVPEARLSNMKHRPVGLGVQGLADVFIHLRLPFDSEGARAVNREIFETMYFAALACSCDLAKVDGHYESYPGSPASKGILQYDMWGVTPTGRWDWAALKAKIAEHGLRNSLLLAPMPTASTRIRNNECFEPYTSNIYRGASCRRVRRRQPAPARDLTARGVDAGDPHQIIAHNGCAASPRSRTT